MKDKTIEKVKREGKGKEKVVLKMEEGKGKRSRARIVKFGRKMQNQIRNAANPRECCMD